MSVQTDERILYNCYKKYLEIKKVKENKVDASLDRTEMYWHQGYQFLTHL